MYQFKYVCSFWIAWFIMGACLSAMLSACQPLPPDPDTTPLSEAIPPEMIFELADAGALALSVKARATVVAYQQYPIQLSVGGRVLAHALIDGQRIPQGSLLLKLEPGEMALDLKEAQGRLDQARMAYQVERTQRLNTGEPLSEEQERMLQVQLGLSDAQIRYDRAGWRLQQTELRAPFSGILSTQHRLVLGAWLNPGERYGELIRYDQVYLYMEVFADQVQEIQIGDPVRVEPLAQACKVISTAALIQTETGTGRIVAQCPNPAAKLLPGMQLEAVIQVKEIYAKDQRGRVRIPRRALLQRDTAMVVFRLRGDRIEWVYVQPSAMNENWVILSDATLNPGDTVAVDRHFTASHDARVRPILKTSTQ
jgi:RND family efflux transporter MFP subunit